MTNSLVGQMKIEIDTTLPQLQFVLEEIQKVTPDQNIVLSHDEDFDLSFKLSIDNKEIKNEGFRITKHGEKVEVISNNIAGLMYGGLEIAEQLKSSNLIDIQSKEESPYMEMRGTKINIPLDVRTPSYTDASDVSQINMPEMWSMEFWEEYIDELAKHRYNFISLWSLHPFPSLVKVGGYEDVALSDVLRSVKPFDEYHHLHGTGLATPEIISEAEVLFKMTIEEKIAFWQQVMKYAKGRNIKFFIITWNIFTNGVGGKYGISDNVDNEITKDYFKESIKQLFRVYPDLAGIGLTTGENMPKLSFEVKEQWAFDTYAKALLEIAEEQPTRKFTLIHRQHQTGAEEIARMFKSVIDAPNIDFLYSFKYAKAHAMSATKQPYHDRFVKDISGMKTLWTLRNDSNYLLRWGAPDFVREFIKNIPQEVTAGMYYGSDQWVWGREFTSRSPMLTRELEVSKHWYHWMIWGRLAYNPEINNTVFIKEIESKLETRNGEVLFDAWQNASMIYPTITGFHWGVLDFKWYPEACRSRPQQANNKTGFHDVNVFIELPSHPNAGFTSIMDYVAEKAEPGQLSPFDIAERLSLLSDQALEKLNLVNDGNKVLNSTVHDIKTMAALGKYYSYKVSGSTNVALYRKTKDRAFQEKAISDLELALNAWITYEKLILETNINRFLTNRVGYVDFKETRKWVEDDILIAKNTHN
jgi:hypothetical protein